MNGINPADDNRIKKTVARTQADDSLKAVGEDWYHNKALYRSEAWRVANRLYLAEIDIPRLGAFQYVTSTQKSC